MKILIVGGGGREHALAWAVSRGHDRVVRCAPGNAGTARLAESVPIGAEDVEALVAHATAERYDLVVVGPEAPLVAGLADRLTAAGIPAFGPTSAAAEIEGSKVFAKRFMDRHEIPTARFEEFVDAAEAQRWLESSEATYPLVVKADGLAAGKGVILADDAKQAIEAVDSMLVRREFGSAGERIIIEEMLVGREASFFVLTDGERHVELATCQDYKRARDADEGPNTGGMGTYSPSVFLDETARQAIVRSIVRPTIDGLAAEERPYRGVLYVGVMLTADGPKVLEYNARFGDPETQVLMPRLDGDWAELLASCGSGNLTSAPLTWRDEAAVCVVLAAAGYPGSYGKGTPIEGLERAEARGCLVFHAGTSTDDAGRVVTSGGRVLGVTATGRDLAEARARAYEGVESIRWEGMQHRTDIALDAIRRTQGRDPS